MITIWIKLHITLKIGLILLLIGTGPLITAILLDKTGFIDSGNTVGLEILAFLSFWPSFILIILGSIITYLKIKKKNQALL